MGQLEANDEEALSESVPITYQFRKWLLLVVNVTGDARLMHCHRAVEALLQRQVRFKMVYTGAVSFIKIHV